MITAGSFVSQVGSPRTKGRVLTVYPERGVAEVKWAGIGGQTVIALEKIQLVPKKVSETVFDIEVKRSPA